jgi:hypothetical protein
LRPLSLRGSEALSSRKRTRRTDAVKYAFQRVEALATVAFVLPEENREPVLADAFNAAVSPEIESGGAR